MKHLCLLEVAIEEFCVFVCLIPLKKDHFSIKTHILIYCTHANICRGMYIFYPIFHCSLYSRAVIITDNLCTKQGNSLNFGPKIRDFKLRAGYNGDT